MNQRKSLKELNLLDKFLFDEAMDDPENVNTMLDIILLQSWFQSMPIYTANDIRYYFMWVGEWNEKRQVIFSDNEKNIFGTP